MKMPVVSPRLICCSLAAFGALMLMSGGHAAQSAADEQDLPASLRSGYVGPIVGPADNRAYAHGTLGLIQPNYGRASLFVAWRIMHLPVGAVANESHRRQADWVNPNPASPTRGDDEIAAWLKTRGALMAQAPSVEPGYFRRGKLKVEGFGELDVETGQCGPDAYAFATRTLNDLVADTSLKDADRRTWIAGQDAVFARCAATPGKMPELPASLPARAPAKLKALNAYQRAAALFYGDDFIAARREFDAIAAAPAHPMRAWATLGSLRAILRSAVRDTEWDAVVEDAWTKRQLRGAEFKAAVAEPAARHNARVDAAFKDFDSRAKAALADPTISPVHAAIRYTGRRALVQLAPGVPLRITMEALARPEFNPYETSALDFFQDLYPRVSPDRPTGSLGEALRQFAWFDFVVTVQACADTAKAQDIGTCDSEHAHALARWQETKDNAWLLATLMTARLPTPATLQAASAARAVPAERPEWASLQFYAARALRAHGRNAEARAALDGMVTSTVIHKRDRGLLEVERRGL
uniref:hypothetical protein n=1 Tax=Variovorax sp. BK018 TaxID=3450241 RepID=UPI00403950D9